MHIVLDSNLLYLVDYMYNYVYSSPEIFLVYTL